MSDGMSDAQFGSSSERRLEQEEIDQLSQQKKAFGSVKNYLHNTLGFTKESVEYLIRGMVKDMMQDELGRALETRVGKDAIGSWLRHTVQAEIESILKRSAGQTVVGMVERIIKEEVRKTVLDKLRVDIKITVVEPPNGVERNIIDPPDPLGEMREG